MSTSQHQQPAAQRRGFTILEMMVSLLIASIAAAGMYSLFTVQSRQLSYQEMQTAMSQNVRFTNEMVGRYIRLAGAFTDGTVRGIGGDPSDDDVIYAVTSYDAGGPDGATDAITVRFGEPSMFMNTDYRVSEGCTTTSISFDPDFRDNAEILAEFVAGDILVCLDYSEPTSMKSYAWLTTSDGDGVTGQISVQSNSGFADYAASCPDDDSLTTVMACSKGTTHTYYIDNDDDGVGPGTPDLPVLMLDDNENFPDGDDIPLVEDIEDIQFAYCLEDNDCSLAGSWVDSISPTEGSSVWMVRMTVVARSFAEDPADIYAGLRPAVENHAGASNSDGDHYFRQVMTTEYTLRNLRYMSDL